MSYQNSTLNLFFLDFDFDETQQILDVFKSYDISTKVVKTYSEVDIFLFNHVDSDRQKYLAIEKRMLTANKQFILFTNDLGVKVDPHVKVVYKPKQGGDDTNYKRTLTSMIGLIAFYENNKQKAQFENHHPYVKESRLIIKKHFSNAFNPSQIELERGSFNAQKHVGNHADVDFNDPLQLAAVQFHPVNHLFYYLNLSYENSHTTGQIIELETTYGMFYVDAKNNLVYHERDRIHTRSLHRITFFKDSKLGISEVSEEELLGLFQYDYDSFVWESAIVASKGRIATDVDPDEIINIVAWPNLSKMLIYKHSMRILSLWSRGEYSLSQTAVILQIPQRYALTIYTALTALNLIKIKSKN
jgi:hypothetical protein